MNIFDFHMCNINLLPFHLTFLMHPRKLYSFPRGAEPWPNFCGKLDLANRKEISTTNDPAIGIRKEISTNKQNRAQINKQKMLRVYYFHYVGLDDPATWRPDDPTTRRPDDPTIRRSDDGINVKNVKNAKNVASEKCYEYFFIRMLKMSRMLGMSWMSRMSRIL